MTLPNKSQLRIGAERIKNSAATVITSVIIMFFTLWATGMVEASKAQQDRIESKVEKVEFDKCTQETKDILAKKLDVVLFEKYEQNNDEKLQSFQGNMKEIKEEIQGIRSDARLDAKELRNEIIQILREQKK